MMLVSALAGKDKIKAAYEEGSGIKRALSSTSPFWGCDGL